ncbi:MAG: hypothetical protein NC822_05840 [Candidatus Omnitrophica bacterium]|nr:hypothetical protein [Candidatus Omnitrophota bacterium]MCM8826414.1 hypothetical protein [Candidatus Omnitrophota bacterium]
MRKSEVLVMVVIFIAIAGIIGMFLAILLNIEFFSGAKTYRSELAFYTADSGVARAKQLAKSTQDCSFLEGKEYLEESYHIPPTGRKTFSYKIYCTQSEDKIIITVGSISVSSE